ncbi:MAG: hypothetical protein ACLTN0_03275 [Coprococcus phoceensis]
MEPKSDVIMLVGNHFSDRMPSGTLDDH